MSGVRRQGEEKWEIFVEKDFFSSICFVGTTIRRPSCFLNWSSSCFVVVRCIFAEKWENKSWQVKAFYGNNNNSCSSGCFCCGFWCIKEDLFDIESDHCKQNDLNKNISIKKEVSSVINFQISTVLSLHHNNQNWPFFFLE